MIKLLPVLFLLFFTASSFAQNDYILLKKKNKSLQYFWKDSYISFQLKDRQWVKGIITKIEKDSFYLKIEKIRYSLMGSDTEYFSGFHYALSDIYAVPKKGVQVDDINGRFKINMSAGNQHWYWIKSGWIFRAGAIGYTGLYVINGLIENNLSFSGSRLGIVAAIFLGGVLLHEIYRTTYPLGHKYHLESSNASKRR
jgi:hypothetical protein